jgi:uncharacterized membrane protein YdjX (TVP38/TMEM64 family)
VNGPRPEPAPTLAAPAGARRRPSWWFQLLVGCAAAVLVALVLAQHRALMDGYVAATRWLELRIRGAGGWAVVGFVLFAALSALLAPFSSAPLTPTAVLAWGRPATLLLLLGGWMLGNIAAYALGRYGAHPLLRRVVAWQRIEGWTRQLPRRRTFVVALLVRMALPSEVGYAYGALRFAFGWYVVLTLLAELPVAALLAYGSEALLENETTQLLSFLLVGLALLVAAAIVRRALRREPPPAAG